jgi:hypothetical protein
MLEIMKTIYFMYHVIMNDPIKTRKVMAITAIIENKKIVILFIFVVTIFD